MLPADGRLRHDFPPPLSREAIDGALWARPRARREIKTIVRETVLREARARFSPGLEEFDRAADQFHKEIYPIVVAAVREAGHDPDDPATAAEIEDWMARAEDEIIDGDLYEAERQLHERGLTSDSEWQQYRDDEHFRRAYRAVYTPAAPPAPAPRRAPDCDVRVRMGRAPRVRGNHRRRGSRRASGIRTGQDPGDPDGESDSDRLSPLILGDAGR